MDPIDWNKVGISPIDKESSSSSTRKPQARSSSTYSKIERRKHFERRTKADRRTEVRFETDRRNGGDRRSQGFDWSTTI